jgi:hypothetical protein
MAYNTPTLLLVGAAQNIVLQELGGHSEDVRCKADNIVAPSDLPELW